MLGTVGGFELIAKIGEGGMGEVFLARDPLLQRDVAIKALRPELAARADLVERFRCEAVALARLSHHNIATLYNFFSHDGRWYMVMELVRGEPLDKLLARRGPLPWREVVGLALQALDGLEHAHRAGIVHRDLKPANMTLTPDGVLKLMDFGVARILQSARLTRTGHLIGTIEYMSPEQILGRDVDGRSDLYSLTIVLYELLTGRVPFKRDSDYALMRSQVEEAPPPPRGSCAQLPPSLEAALLRGLAKSPEQRFADAAGYRAAIAPWSTASDAAATRLSVPVPSPERAAEGLTAAPNDARAGAGSHAWRLRTLKGYPGVIALVIATLLALAVVYASGRGPPPRSSPPALPPVATIPESPEARREPEPPLRTEPSRAIFLPSREVGGESRAEGENGSAPSARPRKKAGGSGTRPRSDLSRERSPDDWSIRK